MKKYSVIDIGTNSVKLLIGTVENDSFKFIKDFSNITRLGKGFFQTGKISEKAALRTIKALKSFKTISQNENCLTIKAVGTMCLRTAENSNDFLRQVKKETGINIEIISGDKEAELSFKGALSGLELEKKEVLVFDTGGGSTEFILAENRKIIKQESIDIGAVYPTETFFKTDPVTQDEFIEGKKAIINFLNKLNMKAENPELIVIGGGGTTLGAVKLKLKKYQAEKVHGLVLDKSEVELMTQKFFKNSIEDRKKIEGLHKDRAEIILAASLIIESVMEKFSKNKIKISDRGLRHGLFIKSFT